MTHKSTCCFLEKNNSPDWIYGKINVVEENNISVGIFPIRKIFQFGNVFFSKYLLNFFNFIPHQAVFIKKEIFEKFGKFDETLKSWMDFDLWIRLKNKTSWIFFNQMICNYKIRQGSQSSGKINEDENKLNLKIVQKRYLNLLEFQIAKIINKFVDMVNTTQR